MELRAGFSIRTATVAVGALLATIAACDDGPAGPTDDDSAFFPADCNLPSSFLHSSPVGRGGIPILDNPEFVSAEPNPQNAYLEDDDRVLGIVLDGEPLAIPHNILWYHEIVNLDAQEGQVAITYCPLTASSLGFDRAAVNGRRFGVSGVLVMNNLIMYDIGSGESFWPQMMGEARCGPGAGTQLERFPLVDMTWRGWRDLYPETRVVSSEVNISRNYAANPYGDYDSIESTSFLFPEMPILDRRRPVKERVLGLPSVEGGEPGIAFPFLALEEASGSWVVLDTEWNGEALAVFWSDQRRGGSVFRPRDPTSGQALTFRVDSTRGIFDDQTGTRWTVTGLGVEGELTGQRLEVVSEAYVAYWGAWAAFHPDTRLWTGMDP